MMPRGVLPALCILALLAGAGAALLRLTGAYALAGTQRYEAQRLRTLFEQLAPGGFDNDPLAERSALAMDAADAGRATHWRYPLRLADRPAGELLEFTAAGGYGGPIRLLLALDRNGRVSGARVLEHKETAGYGDAIAAGRGDWVRVLIGRPAADSAAWRLRAAGGDIDAISGATMTSEAVVRGAAAALRSAAGPGDDDELP